MKRFAASLLALGLVVGLAACTGANDDLVDQYQQGGNQGFISGDGRVQEIAPADRGESITFSGTAVDGDTLDSASLAGDVVVLNFWYAGCGPCRVEAPILEEVAQETAAAGVRFVGVNIYDGPEQARAFENTYGITYPSLLASGDTALKLAFASWTPLQSVPITLVLDREGRVAARFIGAVASESILRTVVTSVADESS